MVVCVFVYIISSIFVYQLSRALSISLSSFLLQTTTTMVLVPKPALQQFSFIRNIKPTTFFSGIPLIDLSKPDSKHLLVKACEEFGFFKVVNHGVPLEFISKLESEAVKFFSLPLSEKEKASPPNPFGYGKKSIGQNGDVGWVEYLLLTTNQESVSQRLSSVFGDNPEKFRCETPTNQSIFLNFIQRSIEKL